MVTSLRPSGKVASTWTSGSISATPSITWSRVSTSRPDHQVVDRAAVAGPFDHPGGQQRNGFRIVQLDAAIQPVTGDHAGHRQQQLLGVGGGQMHGTLLSCSRRERSCLSQFHARRCAAHEVTLYHGRVDVGHARELVGLHCTTGHAAARWRARANAVAGSSSTPPIPGSCR